jgi:hypothetical protein
VLAETEQVGAQTWQMDQTTASRCAGPAQVDRFDPARADFLIEARAAYPRESYRVGDLNEFRLSLSDATRLNHGNRLWFFVHAANQSKLRTLKGSSVELF